MEQQVTPEAWGRLAYLALALALFAAYLWAEYRHGDDDDAH